MENLRVEENGFVSLSNNEMMEINGGFGPFLIILAKVAVIGVGIGVSIGIAYFANENNNDKDD